MVLSPEIRAAMLLQAHRGGTTNLKQRDEARTTTLVVTSPVDAASGIYLTQLFTRTSSRSIRESLSQERTTVSSSKGEVEEGLARH